MSMIIGTLKNSTGFYVVLDTSLTWDEANELASSSYSLDTASASQTSGHLAAITSEEEQSDIESWILELSAANPSLFPAVNDGGGVPYAWIGGSDASAEGSFSWTSGEAFTYSNWGDGSLFLANPDYNSEPDNYNEQDSLAIALQAYPLGSVGSNGYGDEGQWNDIDSLNAVPAIIEFNPNDSRIVLNNEAYAFDVDGNAGFAAKVIGAFLGAESLSDPNIVGLCLEYLDSGTTQQQFLSLAIQTIFGQEPDSSAVVSRFYQNLTGQSAPPEVIEQYGNLLDSGELTISELAMQAVDYELNIQNVDMVGLATYGLAYSI